MIIARNQQLSEDFLRYCQAHPELRFWQALRDWADVKFIYIADIPLRDRAGGVRDTFYLEGRR